MILMERLNTELKNLGFKRTESGKEFIKYQRVQGFGPPNADTKKRVTAAVNRFVKRNDMRRGGPEFGKDLEGFLVRIVYEYR